MMQLIPWIKKISRRTCAAWIDLGLISSIGVTVFVGGSATAAVDISAKCEAASITASQEIGVPLSVLTAISLNETGRKHAGEFRPWPWTVNMEGKGMWFDTEDEARAYVYQNYKKGARSFDVGCFQINFRWHGKAFASIDEMFDPRSNAIYAASFLKQLYAEKGNWSDAAGAYHSRTKVYADRYINRFDKIRAQGHLDFYEFSAPHLGATGLKVAGDH
ncbi:transglycosylase SLT domain-containing protein [Pseudogemmobacter sp. W21_MBD1_M6]|uniref:transglycosylase SLT domain-containing protein n=1 Tax=Pseudogemmobacter sp. W21_MBD1_M6 TaxID=3240271 RepID=UPI003F99C62F